MIFTRRTIENIATTVIFVIFCNIGDKISSYLSIKWRIVCIYCNVVFCTTNQKSPHRLQMQRKYFWYHGRIGSENKCIENSSINFLQYTLIIFFYPMGFDKLYRPSKSADAQFYSIPAQSQIGHVFDGIFDCCRYLNTYKEIESMHNFSKSENNK